MKKLPLCITIDLEDHRATKSLSDRRYEMNTSKILGWLSHRKLKATFFVVGNIAEQSKLLLKTISREKHNIGFHSHTHRPLTLDCKKNFKYETEYGKKLLEDIIGKRVIGFRAPCFSLTPKTIWATEVLADLGFEYSSSVIPTRFGKYCYPGVTEKPFKWKSGLIEYPMVLSKFLGKKFPSIGGLYLRLLPVSFSKRTLGNNGLRWIHLHPQDIDFFEPFTKVENLSNLQSFFYSLNRKKTFNKLNYLLNFHGTKDLESFHKEFMKNSKILPYF